MARDQQTLTPEIVAAIAAAIQVAAGQQMKIMRIRRSESWVLLGRYGAMH